MHFLITSRNFASHFHAWSILYDHATVVFLCADLLAHVVHLNLIPDCFQTSVSSQAGWSATPAWWPRCPSSPTAPTSRNPFLLIAVAVLLDLSVSPTQRAGSSSSTKVPHVLSWTHATSRRFHAIGNCRSHVGPWPVHLKNWTAQVEPVVSVRQLCYNKHIYIWTWVTLQNIRSVSMP